MKMRKRWVRLIPPLSIIFLASTLGACGSLSPANVDGLQKIVGDDLPGAQGLTLADQVKIDLTVARLCGTEIYTREKCEEHTKAAEQRRNKGAE